jgi:hemerythrin-like domain-containing protein
MTESQTFPGLTRQVLEEHQQIHFFLKQLTRSMQGLEPAGADDEVLRRIAAQIEGLRERLLEHFGLEEEGLFRALTDLLPEARGEVQALASDHGRVLEMLEMARIRAQYGPASEGHILRAELDTFLAALNQHEQREDALLTRGVERQAR